ELSPFFERRDRLVVLAELLIREAEMRDEDADIERRVARLPAELGDDGRQLVDDGLILVALLERFRERVIAPRALAVLRDDAARGGFRLREIAEPPVGLRQQIHRAGVGRSRRDDLGQSVARTLGSASPAAPLIASSR